MKHIKNSKPTKAEHDKSDNGESLSYNYTNGYNKKVKRHLDFNGFGENP